MTIILLIGILLFSAFFSASETALTSVSRIKLKYKAEQGSRSAKNALALLDKYDKSLSTFLIVYNVANIAMTAIATVLILSLMPPEIAERYGVLTTTAIVTFFSLTFGDIVPKTIARLIAEKYCLAFSGFLRVLVMVMTPVSAVFLLIQRGVAKIFSSGEKHVSVTEQELLHFIEEIEDEGVLEEHESKLVQSALNFDETTAGEILTPRVNIVAVSVNEDIHKVRDVFLTEGYSRIPVYEKTVDHICGTLHIKDFMRCYVPTESGESATGGKSAPGGKSNSSGKPDINFSIREIMKETMFVASLMKISEVLKLMQKEKIHLAIVVDQYGGTEGLVTLEDILEELVGEIWDEDDEISAPVIFTADNIFEVSGELAVNDFNRYFKKREMSFEIISDSNTVGGWVFEIFGKIPEEKEKIETESFIITVVSMTERRIKKLRFEIIEKAVKV
ncbi:MAG: hemolysin family protein [Oscillospiraceae bacterium]|nr:hemolysin family protein [Oscillospiraceae bacterium]